MGYGVVVVLKVVMVLFAWLARLEALASRSEMLLRLHPLSGGALCACATWMARRAVAA